MGIWWMHLWRSWSLRAHGDGGRPSAARVGLVFDTYGLGGGEAFAPDFVDRLGG